MGRTWVAHGRDENCIQNLKWNTWKEVEHLGDLSVDGGSLLKLMLKVYGVRFELYSSDTG
jgi:hypothetical protein